MDYVKALHVIAMVCWFAGLFYLPRLFVYHAMLDNDELGNERFKVMERKLYRGIMTPSAILTLVFGLALLGDSWEYFKDQPWMHIKLTLVAVLFGFHHWCGRTMKRFQQDLNKKSHTFYRWMNEVPTVLLIGIVMLVIVKAP